MTLIATQRDGLIVVYTREADGELRQRVAIDAGVDESHEELAELAEGMARRYRWDGAQLATPVAELEPADARARKRAYNRAHYARKKAEAAAAPKPVRHRHSREQMAAIRAELMAAIAERPSSTLVELAEVVKVEGRKGKPSEVVRSILEPLVVDGTITRTGSGTFGDVYRYTLATT